MRKQKSSWGANGKGGRTMNGIVIGVIGVHFIGCNIAGLRWRSTQGGDLDLTGLEKEPWTRQEWRWQGRVRAICEEGELQYDTHVSVIDFRVEIQALHVSRAHRSYLGGQTDALEEVQFE
jgi:hypothetical protein